MSLARYAQTNLRSCTIGSRFPSKQLVNNQLEALQLSLSSKRLLSSSAVHFSNNNNNEWRTEPREKTEEQQETAVKKRLPLKVEYDIPRQKKHLYVVPKDQYDASYRVSRMLKETSIEEAMSYTAALRVGLQSTAVWNLLMKACAEQGRANLADKCFVQMRKRGFRPNTFTFTHLLSALANSKSPEAVERAEEWLEKMQYNYNLTPTEKHYNTLLQVYERANYSTNATFQRLRNLPFKPDSITFTILFKCAAREEDAKSVRFLWREMEKELDRSKVQDVNRPPTEQSKLAQKAAELLEKDTTFKEAVKEVQSSRLTLDDPLIGAMLRALAQTATTSDDLWFGIRIIESLYGLRPPMIEKRIKEQLNEKYEPFKSRPMEITNPTLDAILWLCGSLGQFKLGREYYKEAIRQFPAFKPDAAVVKKAGWLGIEESKAYQNAKSNRKNRKD